MRRFLIILILLHYITSTAVAGKSHSLPTDQVIYLTNRPGISILAYKDYEDIRIDSDLDGKIDYWEVKRGAYDITFIYKNGKAQTLKIRKTEENKVKELVYTFGLNPNRKQSERNLLVMNGVMDPLCKEEKQVFADLASFTTKLNNSTLNEILENYLDDSCFKLEHTALNDLKQSLRKVVESELKNKDSIGHCIQSDSTAKELKVNDPNSILGLKVLAAKYALQMKRLSQADESSKGLIVCEQSKEITTVKAHYKESGSITVQLPEKWTGNISSILTHEFIHRAGLADEGFTSEITRICSQTKQSADKGKVSNSGESAVFNIDQVNGSANLLAVSASANTKNATQEPASAKSQSQSKNSRTPASETGGGSSGVDMKSEIAQAQAVAPSAEKLAQTKVDKSPEGIRAAVKESVVESTPVLRMANQVMGASNTPALASSSGGGGGSSYNNSEVAKSDIAAPSSYEPSSSSRGSSSSDTSSSRRYQRTSRYESSNETVASSEGPKVITSKSNNGLAPGERVVEEIDLTKGTNYRAANVPTRGQQGNTREVSASRTTAASREPASAVPPAPTNPVGEVAAPGPISPGSTGGSVGSLSGSSEINTPAAPSTNRRVSGNRGPASSGSTQNNGATSREEVVTFLSNGSYSLTKNKLRDTGFVNTLKSNKVTIIDLYGNSFGASRGDVIFLDDGNKFVRQK